MVNHFRFRVAGISHYQSAASAVRSGDPVTLIPDPRNPFDSNAIRVEIKGQHVGFVPRDKTAALRFFSDSFATDPAKVDCVLGGSNGYLTGLEIVVERTVVEPDSTTGTLPSPVSSGPRRLQFIVRQKVSLQTMLMTIFSKQEGRSPFPFRVDRDLVPANAEWERLYSLDGNDVWTFRWWNDGRLQEVRFRLFTDRECEVLSPYDDGLPLGG